MSKALYKNALFLFFTNPLFYLVCASSVFATGFSFFFQSQFFIPDTGTTNLYSLFSSIPYVSVISIPLLSLRLHPLLKDETIPLSFFNKFASLLAALGTAACIPLAFSFLIPLSVNFFGDVDFPVFISGLSGIVLYVFSASAFCLMIFSFFTYRFLTSFLISSLTLWAVNFVHLLPLYVPLPQFLTSFFNFISFSWHFQDFSKGLLGVFNVLFYVFAVFLCASIASFVNLRKNGFSEDKKNVILRRLLILVSFAFIAFGNENALFKIDVSKGRDFSVTGATRKILRNVASPLRLTYFCSSELKNYYPQVKTIKDYLEIFSRSKTSAGGKIIFKFETVNEKDGEKLRNFGIQGQPLQTVSKTKKEIVYVYSAIMLEYEGKTALVPFVLQTENLEFDLAKRIQNLCLNVQRNAILICGNDFSLEEDYNYVEPWLKSRLFNVQKMSAKDFSDFVSKTEGNLSQQFIKNTSIVILGSKNLSENHVQAIENAWEKGMNVIAFTSPFDVDIYGSWTIEKIENDNFISFLDRNGIAFENKIACDLSCASVLMESSDSEKDSYGNGNFKDSRTINFPAWISVLSQENAKKGAVFSWSSPISTFSDAKPFVFSSDNAWETGFEDENFMNLSNPFLCPKTSREAKAERKRIALGAMLEAKGGRGNLWVVSDQHALSSIFTGFISKENSSGDFRNYDFLASLLYRSFGDDEIEGLMSKNARNNSLYKIESEEDFLSKRNLSLLLCFVLPLLATGIFGVSMNKGKVKLFYLRNSIKLSKNIDCFKVNCIVFISVLVIFLSLFLYVCFSSVEKSSTTVLLNPKYSSAVSKIKVSSGGNSLSLGKAGDFYFCEEISSSGEVFRGIAKKRKVDEFLKVLQILRKLSLSVKSPSEKVLSECGLGFDGCFNIEIFGREKDGERCFSSFKIGKSSPLTGRIFLEKNDAVYETENNLEGFLSADANSWVDHDVFSLLDFKRSDMNFGFVTFGKLISESEKEKAVQEEKLFSRRFDNGSGQSLEMDFYRKDDVSVYAVLKSDVFADAFEAGGCDSGVEDESFSKKFSDLKMGFVLSRYNFERISK